MMIQNDGKAKVPQLVINVAGTDVTVTADSGSTCNIIDETTDHKINEN